MPPLWERHILNAHAPGEAEWQLDEPGRDYDRCKVCATEIRVGDFFCPNHNARAWVRKFLEEEGASRLRRRLATR